MNHVKKKPYFPKNNVSLKGKGKGKSDRIEKRPLEMRKVYSPLSGKVF